MYRLRENNGAAAIQGTAEELREMEAASAHTKVMGGRYSEAMEQTAGL